MVLLSKLFIKARIIVWSKEVHGSKFGSWGIVHHLIEYNSPGIYVYYRSAANSIISKRSKFKQLRLELN